MSSLSRMLAILDLFAGDTPTLSAEEILERLEYSRPTGYRYVRELVSAGLLVRSAGRYCLGPRIIELDWIIRERDPVLIASGAVVRELADRTGCNITQMGIYGDRIITIRHEPGPEPLAINFERGRPLPLFRGAPSKAIIAFMPRARLARLFERHRDELAPEQRRRGFARFAEEMQAMRRAGFAVSYGELDADKVGIAAPVFAGDRAVSGSVCLVLTKTRHRTANQDLLVELLLESTRSISAALRDGTSGDRGRPAPAAVSYAA